MSDQARPSADARMEGDASATTMRKVRLRLIPFLMVLYICNLLDRGNVSFAKLTMQPDLGMSDPIFALGSGLFYLGYLVFEVPSNLILRRTGARLWISRIMVTWGLVSCSTMLVTGTTSFFIVRILLGVAEAGFFPGIILYLTYWFPARERTRAIASFMAANAIAGVINYPLTGAIMQYLDQVWGLHGWQWVFLLEGLPSIAFGILILFYLTDRPAEATWLASHEKSWLAERLGREEKLREQRHGTDLWHAVMNVRVWFLILLYFTVAFSSNAGGLYLPQIITIRFQDSAEFKIGLIAALPSMCGMIGMLVNAVLADRTGRYRLHVAVPAFLAAAGWALVAFSHSPAAGLAGCCLAVTGMMSMLPPFWSLPTSFLSGAAAAGGIALINSVGNVGGIVGPPTVGLIFEATKNLNSALLALALMMLLGGILALFACREPTRDQSAVNE